MQIRLLFRALPTFSFQFAQPVILFTRTTQSAIQIVSCENKYVILRWVLKIPHNKTLNFLYRYIAMSLLLAKYLQ